MIDFKFPKIDNESSSDVDRPQAKIEASKDAGRVQGVVKWFNEQKGFGFIEQANGRDLFVHYKECRGKIHQGDIVDYVLGEGKKGPCATKVRVKEAASVQPK